MNKTSLIAKIPVNDIFNHPFYKLGISTECPFPQNETESIIEYVQLIVRELWSSPEVEVGTPEEILWSLNYEEFNINEFYLIPIFLT